MDEKPLPRLPTNLSSRPKRSEVERSAVPFQAETVCFRPEGSWACGPPKWMKNRCCGLPTNLLVILWTSEDWCDCSSALMGLKPSTPPQLCHPDRRAHGPDGPPKWMKNRCCVFPRTCHLDRSEVERSAVPFQAETVCFSTAGLMGLRPTQVDEKPLLRFTHELVRHPLNF